MHSPIALLGGSFNPAHAGHVHISREAMRLLGVEEVWWLVSPQNPTKSNEETTPFALRLAQAKILAATESFIQVSDFEQTIPPKEGRYYTANTLEALQAAYPQHRFIWLMGADNLAQLHLWRRWQWIMEHVSIAVMDRGALREQALASPAAQTYAQYRVPHAQAQQLCMAIPPAWCFLDSEKHGASSTAIREAR